MRIKLASIAVLTTLLWNLSQAADYAIPQRTENNVIVASYNIKWLGQWTHDLTKLAKVIANFDVCGIIEVKKVSEVAKLADALKQETGKEWGYTYGIQTRRPKGSYYEAYAVVWRKDRVQLGNGVISNIWDPEEVYRNDPFIVSFKRKYFDFCLFLVHTRYDADPEGNRETEVKMLADQITSLRSFMSEADIILLGDFNYDGDNPAMKEMAEAASMTRIDPDANSTFKGDYSGYKNAYDHIYISEPDTTEFIQGQCAVLDSTKLVYGDDSKQNMKASEKDLSDHLPVWAAFDVNRIDDD